MIYACRAAPSVAKSLEQPSVTNKSRDDFSPSTVLQIAKRAGWLCSFPSCRKPTVGATEDGNGEINIGTAAHICAAAPGGPRYDEKMSKDERSSPITASGCAAITARLSTPT